MAMKRYYFPRDNLLHVCPFWWQDYISTHYRDGYGLQDGEKLKGYDIFYHKTRDKFPSYLEYEDEQQLTVLMLAAGNLHE